MASVIVDLVHDSVATKADVQALGGELRADIAASEAAVRSQLQASEAALRGAFCASPPGPPGQLPVYDGVEQG